MHKVVALYGVPRSGTSWLGEILDSCPDAIFRFQPLFSYRFKNRITTESTTEDMEQFFKELYNEDSDDFLNRTDKRDSGAYPCFEKKETKPSILAYKEGRYCYTIPLLLQRYENIHIIGIVRNPYDVLESWMNAPSEYKPEWDIYKEWEFAASKNEYRPDNYYGYYKWKEFLKLNVDMRKIYPDKFITVRYEDLEEDAEKVVKELFAFVGMPFTEQTRAFLEASQSKTVDDAYGVYREKGQERMRKVYLPEDIKKKIALDLENFDAARELGYTGEGK